MVRSWQNSVSSRGSTFQVLSGSAVPRGGMLTLEMDTSASWLGLMLGLTFASFRRSESHRTFPVLQRAEGTAALRAAPWHGGHRGHSGHSVHAPSPPVTGTAHQSARRMEGIKPPWSVTWAGRCGSEIPAGERRNVSQGGMAGEPLSCRSCNSIRASVRAAEEEHHTASLRNHPWLPQPSPLLPLSSPGTLRSC